jgi:hypothetical protein
MHVRMRFIGKALEYLNAKGHDDRRLTLQVSPELVHVGDLIRHPLFPGRNVYVVAREVDFVDRCVNVWLDELPGANPLPHNDAVGDEQHVADGVPPPSGDRH